mmetsp:Transcript_11717/g.21224  ORF Transcript_11717/g.21224 Transcript_11717/m.21224 type:complete len:244 (+) Transcript_11717:476-1207(+)
MLSVLEAEPDLVHVLVGTMDTVDTVALRDLVALKEGRDGEAVDAVSERVPERVKVLVGNTVSVRVVVMECVELQDAELDTLADSVGVQGTVPVELGVADGVLVGEVEAVCEMVGEEADRERVRLRGSDDDRVVETVSVQLTVTESVCCRDGVGDPLAERVAEVECEADLTSEGEGDWLKEPVRLQVAVDSVAVGVVDAVAVGNDGVRLSLTDRVNETVCENRSVVDRVTDGDRDSLSVLSDPE